MKCQFPIRNLQLPKSLMLKISVDWLRLEKQPSTQVCLPTVLIKDHSYEESMLPRALLCAVFSLHAGGFSFGYLFSKILKRNKIECRTLAIEVGMQNSGLGMALASKHFPAMHMVPSPCALSAVVHCLIGSFLAVLWKKK